MGRYGGEKRKTPKPPPLKHATKLSTPALTLPQGPTYGGGSGALLALLDDFFFVPPPLLGLEPPPGVPMPALGCGIPSDLGGGGGGDAALGLAGLGSFGAGSLGSGWVVVPGIICRVQISTHISDVEREVLVVVVMVLVMLVVVVVASVGVVQGAATTGAIVT